MNDADLSKGVELIDANAERSMPPSDRILGEAIAIFRIENSSLVDKDVKQLLSGVRARLMLLHQDIQTCRVKLP